MDEDDLLSDLPLSFEDDAPQEELLAGVPHELDFISPVYDLNEMDLDIQYESKDTTSLHYQLKDMTGSLLEKALRGSIQIN